MKILILKSLNNLCRLAIKTAAGPAIPIDTGCHENLSLLEARTTSDALRATLLASVEVHQVQDASAFALVEPHVIAAIERAAESLMEQAKAAMKDGEIGNADLFSGDGKTLTELASWLRGDWAVQAVAQPQVSEQALIVEPALPA